MQRQQRAELDFAALTLSRRRLLALSLGASVAPKGSATTPEPRLGDAASLQRMRALVRELSGPAYGGRLAGSAGELRSAAVIEQQLRDIGLRPAGTEGYRQAFSSTIVEPDGQSHGNPRNPLYGQRVRSSNILGLMPGQDPRFAHEVVLVSAHRDHLGQRPDGQHYPGANDDLSGVAAVLELAREFTHRARSGKPNRRSLLFVAYGAEEQQAMGPMHHAAHPLPQLSSEQIVMMISIDMIGVALDDWARLTESALDAHAQRWFQEAYDPRRRHSDALSFQYEVQGDEESYLTDAGPFAALGIPNRSFGVIEGVPTYHQVTDDWASLNHEAAAKVTRAILGCLNRVDQDPESRLRPR